MAAGDAGCVDEDNNEWASLKPLSIRCGSEA
jgi:hypothetical protein